MKLSYIIPLYNAEAYIGKCLDSILDSDIDRKEYEIIVIDDGSKDNGQAVVRQYAQKYDNIKLFVQENQGQSVARNYGIREAQGKYIWFVDSDDYVEAKNISSVLDMMDEKAIEICRFNMKVFRKDGTIFTTQKNCIEYNHVYTGEDLIIHNELIGSVCDGIFLRKFIVDNNFLFYPGIIHQDSEFSIRSTSLANRIMYIEDSLYMYRYNENSSTREKSYAKKLKSHLSDAIIARNIHQFAINNSSLSLGTRKHLLNFSNSIMKGRLVSYVKEKDNDAVSLFKEFADKAKSLGVYPIESSCKTFTSKLFDFILNNEYLMRMAIKVKNFG